MTSAEDLAAVTVLLGREPQAEFEVVVRNGEGEPAVICNAPLLRDGTPMPTRYWLIDPVLVAAVSRLEASGGVRAAMEAVDIKEVEVAHQVYATERDSQLPPGHDGPAPFGGVGGTRVGVKCLHAHFAWLLAGGEDPVGRWVAAQLSMPMAATGRV